MHTDFDEKWILFCEKNRVINANKGNIEWSLLTFNYTDGFAYLCTKIPKDESLKIQNTFRQYRYRRKNEMSTLYVKQQTLDKLKGVKFGAQLDSYDEVLEFTFSKEEDIGRSVRAYVEANGLPSHITKMRLLVITLKAIPYEYRKVILGGLKDMFRAGFEIRRKPGEDFNEFLSADPSWVIFSELLDDI